MMISMQCQTDAYCNPSNTYIQKYIRTSEITQIFAALPTHICRSFVSYLPRPGAAGLSHKVLQCISTPSMQLYGSSSSCTCAGASASMQLYGSSSSSWRRVGVSRKDSL